ncbi:uncharacterized protein HD556DRAFT_765096 [Suillus plorans]|uniref:Uncharacterized protein n=1 Tax=Suillus plorans TaxID=116603 RepID=A0A9P7AHZ5_9AGAM|nr:uncharacterized protein HD556DRAFT_765096 [Suillus plorans]KAG1789762.1 hypothetical protein HD556DRAFT_765096 [Suillus plorans]
MCYGTCTVLLCLFLILLTFDQNSNLGSLLSFSHKVCSRSNCKSILRSRDIIPGENQTVRETRRSRRALPTKTASHDLDKNMRANARCKDSQYRVSSCEDSSSFDTMQHCIAFVADDSYHTGNGSLHAIPRKQSNARASGPVFMCTSYALYQSALQLSADHRSLIIKMAEPELHSRDFG